MFAHRKLNKTISLSFAILVMLSCFYGVDAATLAEYRHRVSDAIGAVQQLRLAENVDPSLREQSRKAAMTRLRGLLPAKETVLLEGQSVVVDNSWLHQGLDEYEKSFVSHALNNEMLVHIGERLLALSQRLDETQKGTTAGKKDEDKGRLAEILRRPEYQPHPAEGSAIGRLWDQFLRWLASLFPKRKPVQPGGSPWFSLIAQVLIVAAALAVIGFLVWKFVPRYLQNRAKKKTKRGARIVLGERLEPDQTAADLLAQAEALARSGDLRAAIRKAYIAFLCELGDRKVISLAQHKTNRDYLNSVRERTSLHTSMRGLTNSFEVHWYGFVPPGENDWNDFRQKYQQALRTPSPG
jgi:hypothetical protein